MEAKARQIFYILIVFLLLTAVFVLRPTKSTEISTLQSSMKQQFSIAWAETLGDQPWLSDVSFAYDVASNFYNQAADSAVALLGPRGNSDQDVIFVLQNMNSDFAILFGARPVALAIKIQPPSGRFMAEAAIENIVPADSYQSQISGVSTDAIEPVNKINSWVTIQDNFTGQLYCLAVYNGEVNKYLGPCQDRTQSN